MLTWHDISQGIASWQWGDLAYNIQSCDQRPSLAAGSQLPPTLVPIVFYYIVSVATHGYIFSYKK
jgi:hypothetical protein